MNIRANYVAITLIINKADILYLLTAASCIISYFFVKIHLLHGLLASTSGCSCLSSSENFYCVGKCNFIPCTLTASLTLTDPPKILYPIGNSTEEVELGKFGAGN